MATLTQRQKPVLINWPLALLCPPSSLLAALPSRAFDLTFSLTPGSIAALFGAMAVLAAIPSVSVLAVLSRAASGGFIHGGFTTIGIVTGDSVFILLAIGGLALLTQTLGGLFFLIKYLGGIYLIGLGIGLWRSSSAQLALQTVLPTSLTESFLAGLFITLADQKAALFYLGFLPAFLDLSQVSLLDTLIIITVAVVAVGGVKLIYALMADRARRLIGSNLRRLLNRAAGCIMIAVGLVLIWRR